MTDPAPAVPRGGMARRTFLKAGLGLGGLATVPLGARLLLRSDRWEDNDSIWVQRAGARSPRPPLEGTRRFDVLIIGGGLTGLSTGMHVKQRFEGYRVGLLEARWLGFGASGRNAGIMGDTTHAGVMPGTEDNVRFVRGIIARHGIDCDLHGEELIDPYRLVGGLARVNDRLGVEIYEGSQVLEVTPGRPVRVRGAGFEARADRLVLATNGYTPRLGFLAREMMPLHTAAIVTRPIPAEVGELPMALGETIRGGTNFYWGRSLPDRRLLLGGGIRYSYDNGLDFDGARHLYPVLARVLRRMQPRLRFEVAYRWSGPLGVFADARPRLGRLGKHGNILYGVGYAGEGVTMAVRFGEFISGMIDGREPPAWTLLAAPRWYPSFEPLRYIGINAAIHLGDLGLVQL